MIPEQRLPCGHGTPMAFGHGCIVCEWERQTQRADAAESQLAALRADVERLRADFARPVSKEGRAMNRRKGRMVRASELKKEIDGIMEKFGDTCFYVTGLAWASVALWQKADVDELEAALLAKEPDHA